MSKVDSKVVAKVFNGCCWLTLRYIGYVWSLIHLIHNDRVWFAAGVLYLSSRYGSFKEQD